MKRGGRSTGFCQEAWLLVAQGGWWKPRDILEQLPAGTEVDDPGSQLWVMANRRQYMKRRGQASSVEYSVTPECITPRGIPVGRVNQALFGRTE